MSELKYGVITLSSLNSSGGFDYTELIKATGNLFEKAEKSARAFTFYGREGNKIGDIYSTGSIEIYGLKIKNTPYVFAFYDCYTTLLYGDLLQGTCSIKSGTNFTGQKMYVRYAINEETNDWIISFCSVDDYNNNARNHFPYAIIMHTTFEDGQEVLFGPDGSIIYINNKGTTGEIAPYRALYNDIGANYSSVITRYTMLTDFFAVNVYNGELMSIPRFRYATLYNGGYEVEKFEEIGVGDVYALVPGTTKNSIAICLKEVTWYDVD